ncbi:hypothetical protein IK110_02150 [Candidatus Saccharibacteria bacterium]|nr:hypothetical protein [Candidatus Saccharibacteria bacterium]
MYDEIDDKYDVKAKTLIVSVIVLFVAIIIFIASVLSSAGSNSVKIVNKSSLKDNGLSDKKISDASRSIYNFLKKKGYDVSKSEIVVRDVVDQGDDSGYFIVDIDSIQQTYCYYYSDEVNLLGCPYINESKYPDSYCIGNSRENDDTATVIFGSDLPYDGSIKSGIKYRVFRKDLDHNLYIHIYGCSSDSASKASVEEAVRKMISDRGANPDSFPIKYEFNYCAEK